MTVTNAAVATTKFLFGMCDYTIGSNVGTGDFPSSSHWNASLGLPKKVENHRIALWAKL